MSWTWLMIAFLFKGCYAVPLRENNTDTEIRKSEDVCYLRAELQHCRDQTHMDVKIDGVIRHSTHLNNDLFVCLPVYCDESRSRVVGTVNVVVDSGLTEPKEGFSGNVTGLFSLESECLQNFREFSVITCQSQRQNEELQVMEELMTMSKKESSMQQNSMTCYFRLNARCNHDTQLSLQVGDRPSTLVDIAGSNTADQSSQCVEVPCSGTEDVIITGNGITVNPPDLHLSRISVFSSKEECETSPKDDGGSSVTVTCNVQINWKKQEDDENVISDSSPNALTQGETADIQWNNNWDGYLSVGCGISQGIRRVRSVYNGGVRDRLWLWECHTIAESPWDHCYWTGYVNWFDQPFYSQCAANYVLNGMFSYHDNGYEDRRWNFYCCHAPRHTTKNCFVTGYINGWNAWMDYGVGYPYVFTGAFSYDDNGRHDRVWQVQVCQYEC